MDNDELDPEFVKNLYDIKQSRENFECFAGNDGDLLYWYECLTCECVLIIDYSNEESIKPWTCPICNNLKDFPFKYFSKEEIDSDEDLKAIIEMNKKIGFP